MDLELSSLVREKRWGSEDVMKERKKTDNDRIEKLLQNGKDNMQRRDGSDGAAAQCQCSGHVIKIKKE